jgi:hypothetical protein
LPSINTRPVGAVVVRRKPFAAGQFDIRHNEVKLYSPFVGMLYPEYRSLIGIEAGQQDALKAVHDFGFLLLSQRGLGKRQDARGVPLGVVVAIDKLFGGVGVAT